MVEQLPHLYRRIRVGRRRLPAVFPVFFAESGDCEKKAALLSRVGFGKRLFNIITKQRERCNGFSELNFWLNIMLSMLNMV